MIETPYQRHLNANPDHRIMRDRDPVYRQLLRDMIHEQAEAGQQVLPDPMTGGLRKIEVSA